MLAFGLAASAMVWPLASGPGTRVLPLPPMTPLRCCLPKAALSFSALCSAGCWLSFRALLTQEPLPGPRFSLPYIPGHRAAWLLLSGTAMCFTGLKLQGKICFASSPSKQQRATEPVFRWLSSCPPLERQAAPDVKCFISC